MARNRLGHQLGARHLQREDEHVLPAGSDLVADLRHQRRLAQRRNRADDVQPLVQPAVQRPIQRVKPRGQARRVDAFGDAVHKGLQMPLCARLQVGKPFYLGQAFAVSYPP